MPLVILSRQCFVSLLLSFLPYGLPHNGYASSHFDNDGPNLMSTNIRNFITLRIIIRRKSTIQISLFKRNNIEQITHELGNITVYWCKKTLDNLQEAFIAKHIENFLRISIPIGNTTCTFYTRITW